jgi:hypothetical protein
VALWSADGNEGYSPAQGVNRSIRVFTLAYERRTSASAPHLGLGVRGHDIFPQSTKRPPREQPVPQARLSHYRRRRHAHSPKCRGSTRSDTVRAEGGAECRPKHCGWSSDRLTTAPAPPSPSAVSRRPVTAARPRALGPCARLQRSSSAAPTAPRQWLPPPDRRPTGSHLVRGADGQLVCVCHATKPHPWLNVVLLGKAASGLFPPALLAPPADEPPDG